MEFDNLRDFWAKIFGETKDDGVFEPFAQTTGTSGSSGGPQRLAHSLLADAWLGKTFPMMYRTPQRLASKDVLMETFRMQFDNVSLDRPYSISDWLQILILTHDCKEDIKEEYFQFVSKTERLLYNAADSVDFLDYVDGTIQIYFHIIRAYERALLGDFERAGKLLDKLTEDWMSVDETKQTNILYHAFIHYVCTGNWKRSIEIHNRMWSIVRMMDNQKRYNYGAWDDWTIATILQWFFIQHSHDYAKLVALDKSIEITSLYGNKKALLLRNCGAELISSLTTKQYYRQAATHLSLPVI